MRVLYISTSWRRPPELVPRLFGRAPGRAPLPPPWHPHPFADPWLPVLWAKFLAFCYRLYHFYRYGICTCYSLVAFKLIQPTKLSLKPRLGLLLMMTHSLIHPGPSFILDEL